MTEHIERDDDTVVIERERPVTGTTEIHHHGDRPGSTMKGFLMGVLVTLVAAAIAFFVYLALSDDDDDGNIDVEVPTVDLDVES